MDTKGCSFISQDCVTYKLGVMLMVHFVMDNWWPTLHVPACRKTLLSHMQKQIYSVLYLYLYWLWGWHHSPIRSDYIYL